MAEATSLASSCEDNNNEEEVNNIEEVERSWSDLPMELLILILSNLYAGDVFAFRAACKSWKSVIPTTLSLRPQPPNDSLFYACPSLICSLTSNHIKLFHPLYNQFYYLTRGICQDTVVHCSNYVTADQRNLSFINPFARTLMRIPRSMCCFIAMYFFSRSPSLLSEYCTIIGISDERYNAGVISIIKCGEDKWSTHRCPTKCSFRVSCSPILFRGMYYFFDVPAFK
ncbi:hypothetical protein ACH5RR_033884 [Cinchona calisaya]|uniref:F-box domain-containing protein n=1 Tax=Cinchona calisaya TaxID=153742 RepID=A0ABD2Y996_9GENT